MAWKKKKKRTWVIEGMCDDASIRLCSHCRRTTGARDQGAFLHRICFDWRESELFLTQAVPFCPSNQSRQQVLRTLSEQVEVLQ